MKKFILLLLMTFMFSSCVHTIHDSGVVNKVENYNVDGFKYKVTLLYCDIPSVEIHVLTNTHYQIGDTLQFVKRK